MQTEADIQRRRQMVMEAMSRALKPPRQPMDERTAGVNPQSQPPPMSAEFRQIFDRARAEPQTAIPPELENVTEGRNVGSKAPWVRLDREGNNINVRPFDPSGTQPAVLPTPGPRIAVSTQPAAGITGSLNLPQPSSGIASPNDLPQPNQTPLAPPQPSGIFGPSVRGLGKLDRDIALRNATATADPESDVRVRGDQIDIAPPGMAGAGRHGRIRAGLEAGLTALGNADPDHPLYSLGQGIGGLLTGVASPRAGAKIVRRGQMERLDNDVARGLKLEQQQADLEQSRGQKFGLSTRVVGDGEYPGIEAGTEIRVRIDPRTGGVTDVVGPNNRPVVSQAPERAGGAPHYESDADGYLITIQGGRAQRVTDPSGAPVRVKSKNSEGEVVEVEVGGKTLKVTPGQALSYYGQIGEQQTKHDEAQRERESKFNAAKSEYDSLVEAEKTAGAEKDRAYSVLDKMRRDPNIAKDDIAQADIAQAEQDAQKANDYYRTFGEKKKDAARRMQENQVTAAPTATQPYAGRTMSRANLEKYARDKGLSVEEAQKQVEAQGVRVQ